MISNYVRSKATKRFIIIRFEKQLQCSSRPSIAFNRIDQEIIIVTIEKYFACALFFLREVLLTTISAYLDCIYTFDAPERKCVFFEEENHVALVDCFFLITRCLIDEIIHVTASLS